MAAGDSVGELIERPSGVDLEGASNVLVLVTSLDDTARESYYETLLPDEPSEVDVLAVDYRRTPDQYLDEWKRYVDGQPRRCGIVRVDETGSDGDETEVGPGAVAAVESPTDLTGLGIKIGSYLENYGSSDTIVTYDSLTMLLQYVELERAFRFLHVLTNRVQDADAVAKFEDGEWRIRRR